MKKTLFILLSFFITLFTAYAQKGINFSHKYTAGGKLLMCVDSSAKNIYYANIYPNQPNTYFNYLPEVNNVSIEIYFRKNINVQHYRYTILVDDKPLVVNQSINKVQLKDADMPDEVFRSTTLGVFPVKGKVITTLVYSIETPQNIDKSIFYGKPIPRAKIERFIKLAITREGAKYSSLSVPKESRNLSFAVNELELTIIKDITDIDYLYETSIIDKQTNKLIFKAPIWQFGGYVKAHQHTPSLKIAKRIFKKSGDYEIIIQPSFNNRDLSQKEIEQYATRYTLSITLEEESYTQKELIIYGLIICAVLGAMAGAALTYIKKKEAKKLVQQFKEKEIAKLQLNSIRSQLNPHFLFNALSGIQNLINKNEIDNANKYLSKFARLTRNILDDKELISLSKEKSLLDDYLQMEQLRFGFKYEINHSENLDLDNIEIPSMLLQPFVENAVKHGISQKANNGKITITFNKQANDLELTITDNGNGFDIEKKHSGLGIQLSENRIALLNSIYKENRFTLAIQSNPNGTTINLILTDWL